MGKNSNKAGALTKSPLEKLNETSETVVVSALISGRIAFVLDKASQVGEERQVMSCESME